MLAATGQQPRLKRLTASEANTPSATSLPHVLEFAKLAGIELDPLSEIPVPEAVIPKPDEALADKLLLPVEGRIGRWSRWQRRPYWRRRDRRARRRGSGHACAAGDPGVRPNSIGLPGLSVLQQMVGLTYQRLREGGTPKRCLASMALAEP